MKKLLEKAKTGAELTREEALQLLGIETCSSDYYTLLGIANAEARRDYQNCGSILAQIGIEASPCPGNCAFCSLAESVFRKEDSFVLPIETAEQIADLLVQQGTDELFLMTTANYTNSDFLEYAAKVRRHLPEGMRFVANVGDFDLEYAKELRKVGFTGVYHVCRLREGVDNDLTIAQRIRSIEAACQVGLELYYCVEPIGPEHTYEEMVEEMERARKYGADVAAVMKRTCVPDTKLYERGELSSAELAKICAVAKLFIKPKRAMGVHEPDVLCLMSGANQIYAEVSVNPRDLSLSTETSRGASMEKACGFLRAANWNR
ncbi:MAG: radical SAM protein [Oscillospiraceae bacterium]|nr:radical SAM protein [Oscillospiraceae bacterium]